MIPQPQWYTLKSKRLSQRSNRKKKKKDSNVSGEILLKFSLSDPANPTASPSDTYRKFKSLVCAGEEDDQLDQIPSGDLDELDIDRDEDQETSDETDGLTKPEIVEKRRRRLRLARLKRKSLAARAYQFSGSGTGVQGIVFVEIVRVTDLPPERNGMLYQSSLVPPMYQIINIPPSDANVLRYGSVCCDFSRKENTENASRASQPEPSLP